MEELAYQAIGELYVANLILQRHLREQAERAEKLQAELDESKAAGKAAGEETSS